jgi:2-polyprenyl-6-methoxyphenol hydroxylase-like FAD-dependent oxidoreductase
MLELIKDIFPTEIIEMVKNADLDSLSLTHLRYRSPWNLLSEKSFRKGSVTVAGDAMHVMGPFLGQGGAAGLEDSVVLARHLAQKLNEIDKINVKPKSEVVIKMIGDAIDGYVKERRMRVVRLSAQSYFTGMLLDESSGMIMRLISIFLMLVVFRNIAGPSDYDCGKL